MDHNDDNNNTNDGDDNAEDSSNNKENDNTIEKKQKTMIITKTPYCYYCHHNRYLLQSSLFCFQQKEHSNSLFHGFSHKSQPEQEMCVIKVSRATKHCLSPN